MGFREWLRRFYQAVGASKGHHYASGTTKNDKRSPQKPSQPASKPANKAKLPPKARP
jgi:hypothetical protein